MLAFCTTARLFRTEGDVQAGWSLSWLCMMSSTMLMMLTDLPTCVTALRVIPRHALAKVEPGLKGELSHGATSSIAPSCSSY